MTASYRYGDINGFEEKDSAYKWYVKTKESEPWKQVAEGMTTDKAGSSYTLKAGEMFAKFEIIPKSANSDITMAQGSLTSAVFAVTSGEAAPVVKEVAVDGVAYHQSNLTGTYVYEDLNNDAEGQSRYQWITSTDSAASFDTWTVLESGTCTADMPVVYNVPISLPEGSYIRFAVTPVSAEGTPNTGKTVYSAPVGPFKKVDIKPEAKNLTVGGQTVAAEGLTGLAINGKAEAGYTYTNLLGSQEDTAATQIKWYRGDSQSGPWTEIASGREYTPSDTDGGKFIKFSVTPAAKDGKIGEAAESEAFLVRWRLAFHDEFEYEAQDGNAASFTEKWVSDSRMTVLGTPATPCMRIPENVSVSDGTFKITTRNETNPKYGTGHQWTTGSVWTKERFGPYGYYESSMKYAKAGGLNESFWWMTQDPYNPTEDYDKFMELDFCEGHYPYELKSNLHYNPSPDKGQMASITHYPFGNPGTETLGDNFNKISGYIKPNDTRYGWEDAENSNTYQIFFNDEQIRSTKSIPTVPDDGVIYMSVAVYPGWAGNFIPSEANGSVLEYEYVRYYEELGVSANGTNSYEMDIIAFNSAVKEAEELLQNAVIGTETGMYPATAKDALQAALQIAKKVTNHADKGVAANELNKAIQSFENSEIGDKTALAAVVTTAKRVLASLSAGEGYGQCPETYYNTLKTTLERAEKILKDGANQTLLDRQAAALQKAMDEAGNNKNTSGSVVSNNVIIEVNAIPSNGLTVERGVKNGALDVPETIQGAKKLTIYGSSTSAVLYIPSETTATAGEYSYTISKPALSGHNAVDAYSFGNIPFGGLVKLTISKTSGDKVGILNAGNVSEISVKLTEDSFAAAEAQYTSGEFTAVYEGSNSVSIYTNKLGSYAVYNDTVPTPTPTGNSGNNNNSGWTPGVIVPPAKGSPKPEVKFTDITGHWAENEIRELAKDGVINGKSETEYAPEDSMSRAEFAALIRRALGLNASLYRDGFGDVASNAWYANEIQAIADANIMNGDADGSFRPNDSISREEMAKVLVNAYKIKTGTSEIGSAELSYTDNAEIAVWAAEYVSQAGELGLIKGMDDGSFAPKSSMTRAQGAAVIYRLVK